MAGELVSSVVSRAQVDCGTATGTNGQIVNLGKVIRVTRIERQLSSCVPLLLLYFAAVLARNYLFRNSKIIRLAASAVVSDRGPLACCATGRAASRDGGPVMPLTCGIVLSRAEETDGHAIAERQHPDAVCSNLGLELESGAMGIRTPDLLHAISRQPVHGHASAQVTVLRRPPPCQQIRSGCGTSALY
jgi:hypothetical protein